MGNTTADWIVEADPTGLFTHGAFRWCDVRESARLQAWPDGIVFKNRWTGERQRYAGGQLRVVASGKAVSTKTILTPGKRGERCEQV